MPRSSRLRGRTNPYLTHRLRRWRCCLIHLVLIRPAIRRSGRRTQGCSLDIDDVLHPRETRLRHLLLQLGSRLAQAIQLANRLAAFQLQPLVVPLDFPVNRRERQANEIALGSA